MTIRFAPSRLRDPAAAVLRNGRCGQRILAGANDNGSSGESDTALLVGTLRHFGKYGLHSAEVAAKHAIASREVGDEESFARWLSVCRMLDRRLADAVEGTAARAS